MKKQVDRAAELGPTLMTDKPPQGRFSGLRSGFSERMARAGGRTEFPKGIRFKSWCLGEGLTASELLIDRVFGITAALG